MTNLEFNEKYAKYIKKDFIGLHFDYPEVTDFLDQYFKEILTQIDGFLVYQIKLKFGQSRFYSNLSELFLESGNYMETFIEQEIDKIVKENDYK